MVLCLLWGCTGHCDNARGAIDAIWSTARRRSGVAVWLCVSLEWFPITPSDTPFRAPGHMQTAYPDYRHYTARDYGNRVGIYRLLDAFRKVGAKVSVATNAALAVSSTIVDVSPFSTKFSLSMVLDFWEMSSE